MSRAREYVWIAYGQDRARLPIAVADTAGELAAQVGTTRNNVESQASKFRKGVCTGRYQRVRIETAKEETA